MNKHQGCKPDAILVHFTCLINEYLSYLNCCRCRLPNEHADAPYELSYNESKMSLPWDSRTDTWSQCFRLNVTFTDDYIKGGIPGNQSIPCTSWIYDRSEVENSATTEVMKQMYINSNFL